MTRTWFITGGTPGGFGMAFAEAALDAGDRVTLTARRPGELQTWADEHGDRVHVVALDVTDPAQVRDAVRAAEDRFDGIDVLVNNAGRGHFGSVEGMKESALRAQFELNLFAPLSVIRAVLPGMRKRGNGWIVNVSSVAGLTAAPGFGYYSAAKSAVESVTDALRDEVAAQGINVLAVEPGAFRTRAYAGFANEPVDETVSEYHDLLDRVRDTFAALDGIQPGDPRRGARAVIAAMSQVPPPRRLVLGSDGFDAATAALEQTLTDLRANESLSRGADFPA